MANLPLEELRKAVKAMQSADGVLTEARRRLNTAVAAVHDEYKLSLEEVAACLRSFGRQVTRSRVQQMVKEGRRVRASDRPG